MENLERDSPTGEMAASERNSETSRLVSSGPSTKPSYFNLISNICAFVFVGIICYCCFKDGVSIFAFHPTLMAVGWMVFMTTAINAITPGDLASEWMPIRLRSARHWVIQVCSGIIITIGFLMILYNKIAAGNPQFASLHAKFGLAALIFMCLTMMGGIGALYSLKLKYYLAPIYTKLLHATVGLVTFSLGVITILLGLFSNWWDSKDNGDILRYTSLVLVLTVMLFTILRPSLKIYFRLKERLENAN